MDKIRFVNNPSHIFDAIVDRITANIVKIKFLNETVPVYVNSGFELLNENNGRVMTEYHDYTTIYKQDFSKMNEVELSNDGSIYVEPEKPMSTITFVCGNGGHLNGETIQTFRTYEEIVYPTPVPDKDYVFEKWDPELPKSGEITEDQTVNAEFKYIEPIEVTRENKIKQMNLEQQIAIKTGTDVTLTDGTVEHFTLTQNDQISLMYLTTQVNMGVERIPWHNADHSNESKYYSNADMKLICDETMQYVAYHVALFRDIRIWVSTMDSKKEIEKVTYSIPPEGYRSEVLIDLMGKYNVTE